MFLSQLTTDVRRGGFGSVSAGLIVYALTSIQRFFPAIKYRSKFFWVGKQH